MQKQIVRISSKLYRHLFITGGDKLIATYCILLSSRGDEIKYYSYKAKNNKEVGGYSLLRAKTPLSLHSIEIYVKQLIDLGLCYIDKNGDFVLIGSNKIKEKYGQKLVPIRVGKNLTETALNVVSVRLHSEEMQQLRRIENKQYQRDLLYQANNPKNTKALKAAKRLLKKLNGEVITILDKTVLSNQGYAVVKDGTEDNKFKGAYWKRRFKEQGLITTERNFRLFDKIAHKKYCELRNIKTLPRTAFYHDGYLVEETVSSFWSTDLVNGVTRVMLDTVG